MKSGAHSGKPHRTPGVSCLAIFLAWSFAVLPCYSGLKYDISIGSEAEVSSGQHSQLTLRNAQGQRFSCSIPPASDFGPQEQQIQNGSQLPSELLASLEGQCLRRLEEWWIYEVCVGQHVRQMHLELGHLASQYLLGEYSADETDLDEVIDGSSHFGHDAPHVQQIYKQGAACDTTGGLRTAAVGFECGSGERAEITSVHEPASCMYFITVAVPELCQHPAFQATSQPIGSIVCHPTQSEGLHEPRAASHADPSAASHAEIAPDQSEAETPLDEQEAAAAAPVPDVADLQSNTTAAGADADAAAEGSGHDHEREGQRQERTAPAFIPNDEEL